MPDIDTDVLTISSEQSLVPSPGRDLASVRNIVVNGRPCAFPGDEISYGQLVRLAYPGAAEGHGRSMTITYGSGPIQAAEGILMAHQRTPIVDGETFNVTRTDKS